MKTYILLLGLKLRDQFRSIQVDSKLPLGDRIALSGAELHCLEIWRVMQVAVLFGRILCYVANEIRVVSARVRTARKVRSTLRYTRYISFAYSEGAAASQRHCRRGALGPLAGAAEYNSRVRRRVHLHGRERRGPRQIQRSQSRGYV